MTRAEAIHSYTLANAVAAFEEKDKGSIEAGKLADMVLLSENLMECPEDRIPGTRVLLTVVGGKTKYKSQSKP
jgi:predicted amidohydrolase YtcJ